MDLEPYQQFARERLGFEFHDPELLLTALTHRSYVNEHKNCGSDHNERLEFLGDAILEMITSDYLYRNFDQPEGVMTAWRSAMVRTESIGASGEELGYGPLVRLSKGEKRGSDRAHASIMADCFEAVTGAIYIDQGYHTCKAFVDKWIISKLDDILEQGTWRDPKSRLQELTQHIDGVAPSYKMLSMEGPDHNRTFTVGLYIEKQLKATGVGHSKQEAEANAALEAMKPYLRIEAQIKKAAPLFPPKNPS